MAVRVRVRACDVVAFGGRVPFLDTADNHALRDNVPSLEASFLCEKEPIKTRTVRHFIQ